MRIQVLCIYAHDIRDMVLAEQYCHRQHQDLLSSDNHDRTDLPPPPLPSSSSLSQDTNVATAKKPPTSAASSSAAATVVVGSSMGNGLREELALHGCSTIYQLLGKVLLAVSTHSPAVSAGEATKAGLRMGSELGSSSSSSSSWSTTEAVDAAISLAERCLLDADRLDPVAFLAMLPRDVPLAKVQRYLCGVLETTTSKKRNLQVVYQLLRVREVHVRTSDTNSNNSMPITSVAH